MEMEPKDKIMGLLSCAVGFECDLFRLAGGFWKIQPMEVNLTDEANVFFRWTLRYHREDQFHKTILGSAHNFMGMFGEWIRAGRPDIFAKTE